MKNPFNDFHPGSYQMKESHGQRIVQAKQNVMDGIIAGYIQLVEEEIKDLAWVVEHKRVVKAYGAAVERLRDLRYDQADIEEFCAELDSSNSIPYMIPGPAGLYVSAMVNYSQESHILLKLMDYQRTFHFLGYGLTKGKILMLQGDGGDFTGASLNGGRLVVQGSAGNWCGAGMLDGEILVSKHTGQNTGEWMHGGEIRVDGQIHNVGKTLFGGRIYQQGKLIASQEIERIS
jgi:hypothetical protein